MSELTPLPSAIPNDNQIEIDQGVQQPRHRFNRSVKLHFRSLLAAGMLFLLVVGFVAAVALVQTSHDTRQQASGGLYPKCDYGANNNKAVCLDSEPTYGNCVVCKNGEKHILPNSECGTALCAQPRIKTCSDGNKTYNEGGTACLSFTECVQCRDGHWVSTDRWNCAQNSSCHAPEPTKVPTIVPTAIPTTLPSPTLRLSPTQLPTPTVLLSGSPTPTSRLSGTPTPTLRLSITPSPTSAKLADGSRCSSNANCQSGSCVPTPYGNYCGTTSSVKCTSGQTKCENEGSTAYVYSCNSNGFFVKSERCDGGCMGAVCKTGVCVKGTTRCLSDSEMERCNDAGTAWVKNSCWSGQKCTNNVCGGQTPTPLPPKLPDGSRCSKNSNCLSGNCIPTPYGDYCGSTSTPKCSHGQTKCQQEGATTYMYSCNSNGFFVKSQRCDGGCNGDICNANVCTKGSIRCAGLEAVERCADDGTAWIKSSCWSSEVCSGGRCVPKSSVSPTSAPKLADGSRCSVNANCQSGSCVPTPYGNYCGTTNSQKCVAGQDQCRDEGGASYVYSCNINGFFVKSERCDGGCANGMCNAGVCAANTTRCRNSTDIETCNAAGTAWVASSCDTGKWCYAGSCGSVMPPVASCNLESSCSAYGATCATDTSAHYICSNGTWMPIADGIQIITNNCSQEENDLYLQGFNKAASLIDVAVVTITCEQKDDTEYCAYTSRRLADRNEFVMNCWPDRICDYIIARNEWDGDRFSCESTFVDQAQRAVSHEWAHNWAYKQGGKFDVDSFNTAIGCTSTFFGKYHFKHESPVSEYGKTNCSEAFAEATEEFLYNPCRVKYMFPLQYDWYINHADSPFGQEDGCNS